MQTTKSKRFNKKETEMVIRIKMLFANELKNIGIHTAPMPSGDAIIAAVKGEQYIAPVSTLEDDAAIDALIGN